MSQAKLSREEMQQAVDAHAAHKTLTEAANAVGTNRSTFQHRLREAMRLKIPVSPGIVQTNNPEFLHRQIKRLEGDLAATVKLMGKQDDNLHVIKTLIRDCDQPVRPPKWLSKASPGKTTGVPTLFLSDIHYDEVVLANQINHVNAYNRTIANARLKRLFHKTVDLLIHHMARPNYDYFVLNLGGDTLSGLIHEELRETNEAPVSQSLLALMDQLVAGIDLLLAHFPRMKINCVVGNHGRWDKKPRIKNHVYENYEWILYQFLAKYYKDNHDVVFDIADGSDLPYSIYTTRFLLTHGNQFKGGSGIAGALSPLMLGDARKRKRAIAINQPFDFLLMGHWHTLWMAKGIIVNGSVKGADEFSFEQNFDFELPQQWMFITHEKFGITARWPILLETPGTTW